MVDIFRVITATESEPLSIPSTSPPVNKDTSLLASNASANAETTMMASLEPEPLATLASLPTVNEDDSLPIASANAEMSAVAPDASSEQNDPFHTVSANVGTVNTVVTQVQTTQILTHSRNTNFKGSTLSNVNGNSTTSTTTNVMNQYNYYVSGNLGVLPEDSYLDAPTSRLPGVFQAVSGTVNQVPVSIDVVGNDPEPQNQAIHCSGHAPDQSSHEDSVTLGVSPFSRRKAASDNVC
ncbi:hypothetical protein VKT23_011470 [Stygiomarasmius scandens]|uniref:Uncharacterized protein n=1 Tax=Marasmiellus scandens TaxID=2682957 RepID=A0ABR1JCD4_9AGAR